MLAITPAGRIRHADLGDVLDRAFEDYRAAQRPVLSVSEALRRLVARGLEVEQSQKSGKSK